MSEIDDGGPAYPRTAKSGTYQLSSDGISKRDWFAGHALAGLVNHLSPEAAAEYAYKYADAMIIERKRRKAR